MSGAGWFFAIGLGVLYLVLLFTICVVTFRKGHWVLGIIGIFIPDFIASRQVTGFVPSLERQT